MFQGCTAIELGSGVGMYSLLKIIIITYVYTFYICGRNNSSLKCPQFYRRGIFYCNHTLHNITVCQEMSYLSLLIVCCLPKYCQKPINVIIICQEPNNLIQKNKRNNTFIKKIKKKRESKLSSQGSPFFNRVITLYTKLYKIINDTPLSMHSSLYTRHSNQLPQLTPYPILLPSLLIQYPNKLLIVLNPKNSNPNKLLILYPNIITESQYHTILQFLHAALIPIRGVLDLDD